VSTAGKKPPVGRSKIRPVCDRGVKLVLHSFTRETDGTVTDGAFPEAGLIFDSNGALYGTTSTGGSSKNDGTVFKLTPPAAGQPHPRASRMDDCQYPSTGRLCRTVMVCVETPSYYAGRLCCARNRCAD
jgi:uncharacterized repeat protein (TIGR03803 family)